MKELGKITAQLNEEARIAIIFEKFFRTSFMQCLEKYAYTDELLFCREYIVKEACNFDIRRCMSDDFIDEAAKKGFEYRQDLSKPDVLIFQKNQKGLNVKPIMVYSGNHLFHYTSLESAKKILKSPSLSFGIFEEMNDIAEVRREVFGNIPIDKMLIELGKYRSISMTQDAAWRRGFSIDPLWGYYAQKGNGVCLVFDKNKLTAGLKRQFGESVVMKPIEYLTNFTNAIFTEGDSVEDVKKHIEQHIDDIFFTKSIDWKFEQEFRILLKDNKQPNVSFHFDDDTLIAAILCLPKVEEYKNSSEYKELKTILPHKPILRYTTSLGNKELLDENGKAVCNIMGIDMELAL